MLTLFLPLVLGETLREAGLRHNLYMGSQFKGDVILSDDAYRAKHSTEYALSTVGNQCKFGPTHPEKDVYSLDKCNAAFAYAISVDQKFRGHNLCWGNDNPSWLENGNFSAAELQAILEEHIVTVMQGVKQAANGSSPLAWDVVNEANNDTHPFKPNTWYPKLPDYVDVAFRAARAADPDALLFYNDFNNCAAGTPKAETMYQMVKSMVDRGIPIDGVGLQAHLGTNQSVLASAQMVEEAATARGEASPLGEEPLREKAPTFDEISSNIARYGQLGLQVHITELDVKCLEPCTPEDLEEQADIYDVLLRACLAHPAVCTSFETWGFTDAYTWLVPPQRCPSTSCHPLPFDENLEPKPAYHRMLARLQNTSA